MDNRPAVLEIAHLSRRFGANLAVANANLRIERGEMIGIIGRSGAGKSTLLRLINRMIEPSEGRILANGTDITLPSANSFSLNETAFTAGAAGGTGSVFGTVGAQAVTAASNSASNTGSAIAALSALQTAVTNLGLVQGKVGAGENRLQYAVSLAQSQITNSSAAQAGIRDADVASEAANLTKAQVLQQASIAALAQANSAPQAVLTLLK